MYKLNLRNIVFAICTTIIFVFTSVNKEVEEPATTEIVSSEPTIYPSMADGVDLPNVILETSPSITIEEPMPEEHQTPVAEEPTLIVDDEQISDEDIELIALVTMAEAEGESEYGKRLVIATILNRVDSDRFPDTIYDVIYQPHQFSSMWNGRVNRCEVREEICQLVKEELESRTNYDVIFFNTKRYSKYGVPLFQVGNHYFSSCY